MIEIKLKANHLLYRKIEISLSVISNIKCSFFIYLIRPGGKEYL